MDSGRRSNGANDASSRLNLTLNRLEHCVGCVGFDGCDGRSVEFYGYTRLQQPNDASTDRVRDDYGEQFGWSAAWVRVNIVSTPSEEFVSPSDVCEAIS